MKTIVISALRAAAFAATLLLPTLASAKEAAPADRAAELLALRGSVSVKNAGPYVEVGTFRIQVAVKLGQPAAKLTDNTWIYPNYQVDDSNAHGMLIVQFTQGRVSSLALVTPAVATAMLNSKKSPTGVLVAGNN